MQINMRRNTKVRVIYVYHVRLKREEHLCVLWLHKNDNVSWFKGISLRFASVQYKCSIYSL